MKIFVIADERTYLAYALAGLAGQVVQKASDVPAILRQLDYEQYGLILLSAPLASQNLAVIEELLLRPGGPLLLEVPALGGSAVPAGSLAERLLSRLRR